MRLDLRITGIAKNSKYPLNTGGRRDTWKQRFSPIRNPCYGCPGRKAVNSVAGGEL